MTIVKTIWLVFFLTMAGHIVLYFLLPTLCQWHKEHKEYKKTILQKLEESQRLNTQHHTEIFANLPKKDTL